MKQTDMENKITILTYTTKGGVDYEYRNADGMCLAPFDAWKECCDENGEPTNKDDWEFDRFIAFYISEEEFYEYSDEKLNEQYKDY